MSCEWTASVPKRVDFLVLRYGYVYADHVVRLCYRWKLFYALLFFTLIIVFIQLRLLCFVFPCFSVIFGREDCNP